MQSETSQYSMAQNYSNVLHICKVYLPIKGGVQKVVHNITQSLKNHEHTVVTSGEDGAISKENINGAIVYRRRSFGEIASMPLAPSLIGKVIRDARKYALIAIHYPFPLAELAMLFVPFSPPIVVHWHSEIIAQKKLKWVIAPITLLLLMRAKAIVATSERMLSNSFFLRIFRRKVVFIPYGLEAVTVKKTQNQKPKNYFIIVGRHVSYKGIEVAIKALQSNNIHLVICGNGPLYEKNKKLAKDIGVIHKITFKPYATDSEVVELLSHSRGLVVPSILENEAFALVQVEAMRMSKPIINTNLKSSVPWVARDGKEALTVPANDPKALAKAMESLIQDQAMSTQLGQNGLKRYQKEFTIEKFSTNLGKLYNKVINKKI